MKIFFLLLHIQWQSVHRLIFRESDLTWEIHLSTNKQQNSSLGNFFSIIICWRERARKRWATKKCRNINMQIYFYVLCCHWNWCAECDMFMNKVLYATNNLYIYVFFMLLLLLLLQLLLFTKFHFFFTFHVDFFIFS